MSFDVALCAEVSSRVMESAANRLIASFLGIHSAPLHRRVRRVTAQGERKAARTDEGTKERSSAVEYSDSAQAIYAQE